ncbi:hypothetical protein [Paracoccus aestuariivivens]|uniref:Lipoprotein n=1 Tax=Paracoccus aestuariivivens TaxID=1820333 RepID=A0A6L6J6V9_9RHOB|nr:hypothetical protein [Paracoccus aestuariivivens]MTH76459.1 hypothetical protein [Paracoccus aestuariivivens]
MTGRGALMALAPSLLGMAACAPVPVEQAERSCLQDARSAVAPQTEVGLGVGSGGYRGGYIQLGVTSDYIMGRDPSDVFDHCVRRRSGRMPSRPLYDQPGWRG